MKFLTAIFCLYAALMDLDISMLAGKTRTEVEAVLGQPSKTLHFQPENSQCQCEKVYYKEGQVSIVYMDGKADWITISSAYKLVNLNNAKIREYHDFHSYYLVKTFSTTENRCCLSQ
ncbi:MAG: hypothetical protein ABL895_16775 [Cyclobacteriaceae bacterium]